MNLINTPPLLSEKTLERYSRHILLPEIDIAGQEKIMAKTVMVIGCGGLGNSVIPYLVAAGVGTLIIIDDDRVELSNLQRQFNFTPQNIGAYKVTTLAAKLAEQNPGCRLVPYTRRVEKETLTDLIYSHSVDLLLDCTDHFAIRSLINEVSVKTQTPYILGSALQFDGQLAFFNPQIPTNPCYGCLFSPHGEESRLSCAQNGVYSMLVGMMGVSQGVEALKFLAEFGEVNHKVLRHFDALNFSWTELVISKNPQCLICA